MLRRGVHFAREFLGFFFGSIVDNKAFKTVKLTKLSRLLHFLKIKLVDILLLKIDRVPEATIPVRSWKAEIT